MMRLLTFCCATLAACAVVAEETRLLRHPDRHGNRTIFSYMGDIWIYDGKTPARRLTSHPAADVRPKFSPDGRWVAFSSNRTGNWDVFVTPAEGGPPRQLTFHTGSDLSVGWTPDSRAVIVYSGRDSLFNWTLYKVPLSGAPPERLLKMFAAFGSFSSDGRFFAFNRRYPSFTRKGYRGSSNREIWLFDFQNNSVKRLTKNDFHDNCPMFSGNSVLFASEKDGTFNIWKIDPGGGEATQLTFHKGEGVRYPSISSDGKTVVYEQGFGIWELNVENGRYRRMEIPIRTDYYENPVKYEKIDSTTDDYSVSPDGKRVAVSVHGEIFTVPLSGGRVVRITDSPWRDRRPVYGPKGKRLAFISDASGRDEVYVVDVDGKNLKKITNSDMRKLEIDFSPDGKMLSVTENDHTLKIYDLEKGACRTLLEHKHATPYNITWSPDGRWIAYLKTNADMWQDVYIVSTTEEKPVEHPVVERMPYDEWYLHMTREKIFFLGDTSGEGDYALYAASLSREEVDPDDPEAKKKREEKRKSEKGSGDKPKPQPGDKKAKPGGASKEKRTEMKVDVKGIEKRVRKILSVPGKMRALAVSKDGAMVVLVREPRGRKEIHIIYSVSADGKKLREIGSGSSIRSLRFSPDGKRIFFLSGKNLYYKPAGGGPSSRVSFRVTVKVDRAAEHRQVLLECWRVMKHVFYDAGLHGTDWEAVRRKYEALLPSITDKEALGDIINRMFGELNASHMGMYTDSPYEPKSTYQTMSCGFEMTPDAESGLYRVSHVYKDGPADREWVDVNEGDYVLSIDGKSLKPPDNPWRILNHTVNDRVEVVVSADPKGGKKRTSTIKLIGLYDVRRLRYAEWVDANRKKVDALSNGRIGYVHIPAMSGRSLERFKKELMEFRLKEGLVIDVRFNGGGNIDQELIDILERRQFGNWRRRGSTPHRRPWNGFFGRKVVLINERSFSDAEVFPRAFKDLHLGKLVGVPTGGGVIGTGSYRLIDGSVMRTPHVGVYLMDGTNLENWGVRPDVYVENTPEDELAGRDPQLERAVSELLKDLDGGKKASEKSK